MPVLRIQYDSGRLSITSGIIARNRAIIATPHGWGATQQVGRRLGMINIRSSQMAVSIIGQSSDNA
jgi:hypothetical protein